MSDKLKRAKMNTKKEKKLTTKEIFVTRFTDLIEAKDLSQKELSANLNLSKSTISSYLSGKSEPTMTNLVSISKELNVSVDYLLGLTNVKAPNPSLNQEMFHYCKIMGLNKDAILELNRTAKKPLTNQIISYLIEKGILYEIVSILEESLIWGRQYKELYKTAATEKDSSMLMMEYKFNKVISGLYSECIQDLDEKLNREITSIVDNRWIDFVQTAIITKDKMEELLALTVKDKKAMIDENYSELENANASSNHWNMMLHETVKIKKAIESLLETVLKNKKTSDKWVNSFYIPILLDSVTSINKQSSIIFQEKRAKLRKEFEDFQKTQEKETSKEQMQTIFRASKDIEPIELLIQLLNHNIDAYKTQELVRVLDIIKLEEDLDKALELLEIKIEEQES